MLFLVFWAPSAYCIDPILNSHFLRPEILVLCRLLIENTNVCFYLLLSLLVVTQKAIE